MHFMYFFHPLTDNVCVCVVRLRHAFVLHNIYLQDMIHIADTKVARRYGDFFIRQIHKFEEVSAPPPSPPLLSDGPLLYNPGGVKHAYRAASGPVSCVLVTRGRPLTVTLFSRSLYS